MIAHAGDIAYSDGYDVRGAVVAAEATCAVELTSIDRGSGRCRSCLTTICARWSRLQATCHTWCRSETTSCCGTLRPTAIDSACRGSVRERERERARAAMRCVGNRTRWRTESGSPSALYHSFDYGHVHWVAYSCEKDLGLALDIKPGGEQYTWLENDLKKAAANRANVPWIVLFGHRPLYCSNTGKRCTEEAEYVLSCVVVPTTASRGANSTGTPDDTARTLSRCCISTASTW